MTVPIDDRSHFQNNWGSDRRSDAIDDELNRLRHQSFRPAEPDARKLPAEFPTVKLEGELTVDKQDKAADKATRAKEQLGELVDKVSKGDKDAITTFASTLLKSKDGQYVDAVFNAANKGDAATKKAFRQVLDAVWKEASKDDSVMKQLEGHSSKEMKHWGKLQQLLHVIDDEDEFSTRQKACAELAKFAQERFTNADGLYALGMLVRANLPDAHKEYSAEVRFQAGKALNPIWAKVEDDKSLDLLQSMLKIDNADVRRWLQHRLAKR